MRTFSSDFSVSVCHCVWLCPERNGLYQIHSNTMDKSNSKQKGHFQIFKRLEKYDEKAKPEVLDAEFIKPIHLYHLAELLDYSWFKLEVLAYTNPLSPESKLFNQSTLLLTDQTAFGASSPLPVTNPTWRRTVEAYSFSG